MIAIIIGFVAIITASTSYSDVFYVLYNHSIIVASDIYRIFSITVFNSYGDEVINPVYPHSLFLVTFKTKNCSKLVATQQDPASRSLHIIILPLGWHLEVERIHLYTVICLSVSSELLDCYTLANTL